MLRPGPGGRLLAGAEGALPPRCAPLEGIWAKNKLGSQFEEALEIAAPKECPEKTRGLLGAVAARATSSSVMAR